MRTLATTAPQASLQVTVDRWFASTGVGVAAVIRADQRLAPALQKISPDLTKLPLFTTK